MKKHFVILLLFLSVFSFPAACTKGYQADKSAGDLEIILRSKRYPLSKGDNSFTVSVRDSAGKAVTDAAIDAKYYLSAAAGPAVEYRASATRKGKRYLFTATIPTAGTWKIDVMVTQPGKPLMTATFTIDAK